MPDDSSLSATAAAHGGFFAFCGGKVEGQLTADNIGKHRFAGVPDKLIDTPLDTVLGDRILLKGKEKFLAVIS